MKMTDLVSATLQQRGFWAHLTGVAPSGKSFLWKCFEEAPRGNWTDTVLDQGNNVVSLNKWIPPWFPWIAPVRLQANALVMGPQPNGIIAAQVVVKVQGSSYTWRPLDGVDDTALAYEPNGLFLPKLPWHVFISPRYVPNEYMFYVGGY
jgi:hypothetical protein